MKRKRERKPEEHRIGVWDTPFGDLPFDVLKASPHNPGILTVSVRAKEHRIEVRIYPEEYTLHEGPQVAIR